MARVTLSGRNNCRDTRTVYLDGKEIGRVIFVHHPDVMGWSFAWEARDLHGRCHGDRWLSDWNAADALSRSYNIPLEVS